MGAVWARVRNGFRRSSKASIALIVMIGFTGAMVMASAAGARRTDSAWTRLRENTHAYDVATLSCPQGNPWAEVDLEGVAALPVVEDSALWFFTMGYFTDSTGRAMFYDTPNTDVGVAGPADAGSWAMSGAKVLDGRMPDPTAAEEITIGYRTRQDPAAVVGQTVYFHPVNPDSDLDWSQQEGLPPSFFGEPIPLTVVGITLVAGPGEETKGEAIDVLGTPAFLTKYGSLSFRCSAAITWLSGGLIDVDTMVEMVQGIEPNATIVSAPDEASFVRRNTHQSAVALWIFAATFGVGGLIVFGQALARQASLEATENPTLRALGMTRVQMLGISVIRALVIGAVASALAVGLAIAGSALLPLGLARLVEPSPGVSFDPQVILGGASFLVLAVLAVSAVPGWRAARVGGDVLGTAVLTEAYAPSALAASAARAGFPPPAMTGIRLALEPGRGRTAVPVRSAIVGLVSAVVALVVSLTFTQSFDHLLSTPRLLGLTFDVAAGNPFAPGIGPGSRRAFVEAPGFDAVAGGNFANSVAVRGSNDQFVNVNVWGLEQIRGEQHLSVIEGRWPTADGEIALGSGSMRTVGAGIGDIVGVSSGGEVVDMEIVGRVVFPQFGFGPGLGEGAGMTFTQLQQLYPGVEESIYLATLAPGVTVEEVSARMNPVLAEFGMEIGSGRDFGGYGLDSVRNTRWVPVLLAGMVALMAIAMLAHTLLSSVRRRRRDFAILKTLGFTKGQVSTAVAWQASTFVLISLAIGIPLGVVLGRWAWNAFANQLGVFPVVVVPIGQVLLITPLALLIANVIALWPGRGARRTKPAVVLRAE